MKLSTITFLLILLLVSVNALSQPTPSPTSQPTATPSPQSSPNPNMLTENDRSEILKDIEERDNKYNNRWNQYRAAYLGCTLIAALLAAISGLLPKLRPVNPDDTNAKQKQSRNENTSLILSAIAAFLLVVNTTVGFSGIGIANRNARDEIRGLRADILDNKVSSKAAAIRKMDEIEAKKSHAAAGG